MVAEIVDAQRAAAAAAKASTHLASPSDIDTDTDDEAAEAEYQAWTRRELARVKREEAMRDPAAAAAADAALAGPTTIPGVRLLYNMSQAACPITPFDCNPLPPGYVTFAIAGSHFTCAGARVVGTTFRRRKSVLHVQERTKTKFLQKYYHKGAFFQSGADDERGTVGGDAIYARDFTGATGEDKFDREALPAVMQARLFACMLCVVAGSCPWLLVF